MNSSTIEGAIARLASMNSSSCWNTAASVSVEPARLQNSPISRFFRSSRRTTCTQRKITRLSIFGIRPRAVRLRDEIGGRHDFALLRAQPRHRLVVADLALRQRHDRLQVEVDAVGVDGAANEGQQSSAILAGAALPAVGRRLGGSGAAPLRGARRASARQRGAQSPPVRRRPARSTAQRRSLTVSLRGLVELRSRAPLPCRRAA